MALLPAVEVSPDQALHMIPKCFANAQHRLDIVPAGTGHALSFVYSTRNLVEVSAEIAKLGYGQL